MKSRNLIITLSSILLGSLLLTIVGCNTSPQVSGIWSGSGQFSTQIPKTAGNTAMQKTADVPLRNL